MVAKIWIFGELSVELKSLVNETYNCESCGHAMDRDLNAAINLSRLAKP
ncbi:MAG: zinc ribbon domain-containing protein [Microcoleus sp.]